MPSISKIAEFVAAVPVVLLALWVFKSLLGV